MFLCLFVQLKSLQALKSKNGAVKDLFAAYEDLRDELEKTRKEVIEKIAKVEECKDSSVMRSFFSYWDPGLKRCVCGGEFCCTRLSASWVGWCAWGVLVGSSEIPPMKGSQLASVSRCTRVEDLVFAYIFRRRWWSEWSQARIFCEAAFTLAFVVIAFFLFFVWAC